MNYEGGVVRLFLIIFSLTLKNLTPKGELRTTLPGHRSFVLLRIENGLFTPLYLI